MNNIQYLKENGLYEDFRHFKRLAEAYFPEDEIEEAGEDEQPADPSMGAGGQAPGMGDPNAQAMDGGGGQMPPPDGTDPNIEPEMGADPNMQQGSDMGMMPDGPEAGLDGGLGSMGDGGVGDGEDDGDFIDVEGLTTAQDKLNVKQNRIGRDLSKVDDRIEKLIDTVQSLLDKVDSNNSEIESLKAEVEKRNPTSTERLNLRSVNSFPYNVKLDGYWSDVAKAGNYQPYADNEEPTTDEYVITNSDVDNVSDDIAKTFFKPEDEDIQTLAKIFNLQ